MKVRHGHDGPVRMSVNTYRVPKLEDGFISTAKKVEWLELENLQDLESNNGIQRAMRYVSPDGRRQDVAYSYLHPRLHGGNYLILRVVVKSKVAGLARLRPGTRLEASEQEGLLSHPAGAVLVKGHYRHHLLVCPYRSSLALDEALDDLIGGRLGSGEPLKNNRKILGRNGIGITCKLRPNETDVAALRPAFQNAWDREFKTQPNRPLVIMCLINFSAYA
ncbi:hypothetical protein F4801DRAFT_581685 [Xylaria longipes]|nr:hypothetical protein F4801DRAFT_581685 [Xylaria longipes]RYC64997.1 hypothetical protein CHU98_g1222 [Xylaria longipes]